MCRYSTKYHDRVNRTEISYCMAVAYVCDFFPRLKDCYAHSPDLVSVKRSGTLAVGLTLLSDNPGKVRLTLLPS